MNEIKRHSVPAIVRKLVETPSVFQVITGPRQVGKTTASRQIAAELDYPSIYATADYMVSDADSWLSSQWQRAEMECAKNNSPVLLILDEVQKLPNWSEAIKYFWDGRKADIRLLLLGSSALLLQKGLTESLAGRFFLHRFSHWDWAETQEAFGWSLEDWFFFGGYPGAARFVDNEDDWKQYVRDALVESTISRDVLQMQPINKPALLRNLFGLAAAFPAQLFSYNKMLGQLNDAGNTTTLAHYLTLLDRAYLVSGLELFSKGHVKKRGSSPKLVLWNNALINGLCMKSREKAMQDSTWRGRLIENAVGAHLLNYLVGTNSVVTYWRRGPHEVDYVLSNGESICALEVKSGRPGYQQGLSAFRREYPDAKAVVVGPSGIPFEVFFKTDPIEWLK